MPEALDGTGQDAAVAAVIAQVGRRVRAVRLAQGMARRELSERSGVSPRYLAQLEGGDGNISIGLLQRVALALGLPIGALLRADGPILPEAEDISARYAAADPATRARVLRILDPGRLRDQKAERICLIGLRGAGKSTLGALVAGDLGLPFVELKREIEDAAGMPTAELIDLCGQEGYRDLEAAALSEIVARRDRVILAVGGGIVAAEETFATLLSRFNTIWIRAAPAEHMDRVRAQGDLRPMAGNPRAMIQLRQILKSREAQYRQADHVLDTSGKSVETARRDLRALIASAGILGGDPA